MDYKISDWAIKELGMEPIIEIHCKSLRSITCTLRCHFTTIQKSLVSSSVLKATPHYHADKKTIYFANSEYPIIILSMSYIITQIWHGNNAKVPQAIKQFCARSRVSQSHCNSEKSSKDSILDE